MNFNLLLEAYLSNYRYDIPKNKEQLLYDFYVFEFLDKGPSLINQPFLKDDEETIKIVMGETKEKLLSFLKQEMLNCVQEAIRHELTNLQSAVTNKSEDYLNNLEDQLEELKGEKFVRKAEWCFSQLEWLSGYGGPVWARICDAWLKLNSCPDNERYIWIDHIYDLQHNTNSIFDKIQEYYKIGKEYDESVQWLKLALTYKANLKTPSELLLVCSSSMKRLAAYILKLKGYPSEEDAKSEYQKSLINQIIYYLETHEEGVENPDEDKDEDEAMGKYKLMLALVERVLDKNLRQKFDKQLDRIYKKTFGNRKG